MNFVERIPEELPIAMMRSAGGDVEGKKWADAAKSVPARPLVRGVA
jgi:hypothetical protein